MGTVLWDYRAGWEITSGPGKAEMGMMQVSQGRQKSREETFSKYALLLFLIVPGAID